MLSLLSFICYDYSSKSFPKVSNGKNISSIDTDIENIANKIKGDKICISIRAKHIQGIIIPPLLPIAIAVPMPVALILVLYTSAVN